MLLKWTARDGKLLIYDFAEDRWFIFMVCLLWKVTPESQNVVATPVYALFFLEELLRLSSNSTEVILHLEISSYVIAILSRYHTGK